MTQHPLADIEIAASNVKCFSLAGSGFVGFEAITLVVGRNNSGKSTIVDILESLLNGSKPQILDEKLRRGAQNPRITFRIRFDRNQSLKNFVSQNYSQFANTRELAAQVMTDQCVVFGAENGPNFYFDNEQSSTNQAVFQWRESIKNVFAAEIFNPLRQVRFYRILAERNVEVEQASTSLTLLPSGQGLTNLVRAFLHESRLEISRVESDLLNDLNEVFQGDSEFERILCRVDAQSSYWEIFLRERHKGDIRLSQSGSSLKTIFLILCYFRLLPFCDQPRQLEGSVIAIEEPENNLHPSLLRRLLEYLARRREQLGCSIVLTSHSPVCIDWATRRSDTAIVHVRTIASGAVCANTLNHEHRLAILDDLDVRGSDLLQSNGIIWVEGPSDRVYLRKWIDLASDGRVKEGIHYTFMYYAGKVLSHFDGASPQELTERISVLSVNRNAALVMDSDRHKGSGQRKPRLRLNATKLRMISEIEGVRGIAWVTAGREIENYVSDAIWNRVLSSRREARGSLVSPVFKTVNPYEDIPERIELSGFHKNKVMLASAACEVFEEGDLDHLDLRQRVSALCEHINRWNGL